MNGGIAPFKILNNNYKTTTTTPVSSNVNIFGLKDTFLETQASFGEIPG